MSSLLRDIGVPLANPSPIIQERLGISSGADQPAVLVGDRTDRQGVTVTGSASEVGAIVAVLAAALPRAVSRAEAGHESHRSLEFPSSVKDELDQRRRQILPTVQLHHQLKTIASERVDAMEKNLARAPERLVELSESLRTELVERHIRPGLRMSVEHVKPAGQTYDLGGRVGAFDGRYLRLDRRFRPGGMYDSLEVPRREGDYGRLDMEVGSGIAIRRYFRANGRHLGDLYNLATGAEIYPGRVRYVDLELDVLHMPGEPPRVVDEVDLERAWSRGFLSDTLVEDAWTLADQVIRSIEDRAPS